MKSFLLLGRGRIIELAISEGAKLQAIKHNEFVKRNRFVIEILIEVVCFLGKQGLEVESSDKKRGIVLNYLNFSPDNNSLYVIICSAIPTSKVRQIQMTVQMETRFGDVEKIKFVELQDQNSFVGYKLNFLVMKLNFCPHILFSTKND
ncbi:hypothetical protein ANN_16465 [Periplaneta americana]|uniref:Uncharacterized protein n=1 Tax=Periplaneta americana TaxID=6978 RepID=A0ABQ8SKZ0_PERAM|nr:hypothetical protein ANN_16465 [Periplaneta americana]